MEKGNALVVLCASNLRCRCTQLLFFLSLFLIFISGIQQKKKGEFREKKRGRRGIGGWRVEGCFGVEGWNSEKREEYNSSRVKMHYITS